jgi:hypothetical protein
MMVIGEDKNNDDSQKKRIDIGWGPKTPNSGARVEGESGQQFNERVLNGDGFSAKAAFPPQYEVGQDRDIVIETNRFAAVRATGSGKDYRFPQRDPIDAYIQEASDYQSEQGVHDQFWIHAAILNYRETKVGGNYSGFLIYDRRLIHSNRQSQIVNPENYLRLGMLLELPLATSNSLD